MNDKHKIVVEFSEDYAGYVDYFRGHGHAFAPDNLAACLSFSIGITGKETVKEIVDAIAEEIENSDFSPVNEELFRKHEDEIRNISTQTFIEAFKDSFGKYNPEAKFFHGIEVDDVDDEDYIELPRYLGFFHVYVEEE